jgi:hypothetical protein
VTAVADLISPANRDRLAARLAELRELASLMRERAGLAAPPPPVSLHKMRAHVHSRVPAGSEPADRRS